MLSPGGRLRRGIASALALGGLLVGTFWGNDFHFPFGPFRMYSVANRLDGRIRAAIVEVRLEGSQVWVAARTPGDIGMKRAEVEGQLDRFVADPRLLRHLATTYARLNPSAPEVTQVRVREETTQMRGGRPTGVIGIETLASWSRA